MGSININTDCTEYKRAAMFLESSVWGKNTAVLAMVEMCLDRYGFVPDDREGVKALERWAKGNCSGGVVGVEMVVKKAPPKKKNCTASQLSPSKKTSPKQDKVSQHGQNDQGAGVPVPEENKAEKIENANSIASKPSTIPSPNETMGPVPKTNTDANAGAGSEENFDPFAAFGIDMSGIV